ncbi:hypothetical protein Rhal01_01772 [Rubritalea halochordaticola]|uniref:Uncharacterized protein n=1 Tax=Rubritalea halochordaticola TaxID=714537 RepID=A0ABP9UYS5_9BACT
MRSYLAIILACSLASCDQKAQPDVQQPPETKDIVIQDPQFQQPYALTLEEDTGISAHLLPPYCYLSIKENGSHEYIYVLDEEKRPQWSILVYSSANASGEAFQIFKETPTENGVKRSPITDKELSTHLDIIERKLIAFYGEDMYLRYYTGGLPSVNGDADDDPLLISMADDSSLDAIEQRMASAFGEKTLYHIAHLIHYLRATLNK